MSNHPFTPTYIQMAKAAEEIQAMRIHSPPGNPRFSTYELGDAIIDGDHEHVAFLGDIAFEKEGAQMELDEWSGEVVYPRAWLPRLDQLLGILGDHEVFMKYVTEYNQSKENKQIRDWHEFVLVMIMREKYGKSWSGKGWVKA